MTEIIGTANSVHEYSRDLLFQGDAGRRQAAFDRLPVLVDCLAKLVDIAERVKIAGLDEDQVPAARKEGREAGSETPDSARPNRQASPGSVAR
jgi:hypothetical protein